MNRLTAVGTVPLTCEDEEGDEIAAITQAYLEDRARVVSWAIAGALITAGPLTALLVAIAR